MIIHYKQEPSYKFLIGIIDKIYIPYLSYVTMKKGVFFAIVLYKSSRIQKR